MNLRKRSVRVLAALVATATLAACTAVEGDPSATASPETSASPTVVAGPPPGRPDPCDLISAERLNELSNADFASGVFNSGLSDSGRSVCDWRPADEESTEPRLTITVNWGYPDIDEHRALAEEIYGESETWEPEGVTAAYGVKGFRTIAMEIDGYFVKVSYIRPSKKDAGSLNKKIATEVIANFPG